MKFLVLGASGMAGHMISIYLKEKGHEVTGFSRRKNSFVNCIAGDVRDLQFLERTIRNGKYDSVINVVGILNQNAELYKETAVFINAYLPHFLSAITENMDTQIIQISTDCVFSGAAGHYTEKSLRDGTTFYDRTKALGELEDEKNLTLRNSIIGPDINPDGIGLLNWFMKEKKEVYGFTNVYWTGLTTLELAKVIEAAAKEKCSGLYNMVYEQSISKYDLLTLFNRYIRKSSVIIQKNSDVKSDKSLMRTNYEFNYKIPDYDTMLRELSVWMKEHAFLYPHYILL